MTRLVQNRPLFNLDKLNEIKGAPQIETGRPLPRSEAEEEGNRIWQPKSGRGKNRGRKGAAK